MSSTVSLVFDTFLSDLQTGKVTNESVTARLRKALQEGDLSEDSLHHALFDKLEN